MSMGFQAGGAGRTLDHLMFATAAGLGCFMVTIGILAVLIVMKPPPPASNPPPASQASAQPVNMDGVLIWALLMGH